MNIARIILLSLAVGGCDLQDNQEDEKYYEGPVPVYDLEIISITSTKIEFNVLAGVPTPCNYYSKTELVQENNGYYIKIYSRWDGEACIGVLSTIEVPVSINVTSGEKVFYFWRSDTTSLDTTITIP